MRNTKQLLKDDLILTSILAKRPNLDAIAAFKPDGGSSASIYRAVVRGGAGGTLAPPEFRSSVNPIPTRGGRLCPPHYC